MSITFTTAAGGPEVNMANGNAMQVFDLLGVPAVELVDDELDPDDYVFGLVLARDGGQLPAEDFLGRVLLALGLLDVATDDEHGRPAVRDGRWIDCGRRSGYLAGRLAELHEIATWALRHHTDVIWS